MVVKLFSLYQLHKDVGLWLGVHNLINSDDVGVFQSFVNLNFSFHLLYLMLGQTLDINNFDSNFRFCKHLKCFINWRVASFSKQFT